MNHFKYTCQLALFSLNKITMWFHWNISVYVIYLSIIPLNFCFSDIMPWWFVKYHKERTRTCRLILFPVKWFMGHNSRESLEYKKPSKVIAGWSYWLHRDSKPEETECTARRTNHGQSRYLFYGCVPNPTLPELPKTSPKPLTEI